MYRYSEKDQQIISVARKRNKDKLAEKRLYALELRASGKSAEEVSAATYPEKSTSPGNVGKKAGKSVFTDFP